MTTAIGSPLLEPVYADSHESQIATAPSWRSRSSLSSFGVSFVVHGIGLFILACIVQTTLVEHDDPVVASLPIETPPEEYKFDNAIIETIGNGGTAQGGPAMGGDGSTNMGTLTAVGVGGGIPRRRAEQKLQATVIDAPSSSAVAVFEPHDSDILASVQTAGTTEHAGGVAGAIDRLTFEIAGSLRERETLAIWLFDASLSLRERRQQIADRFENVYKQLGQLKVGGNGALKTAIVSFGKYTHVMTEQPLDNITEMVQSVRDIDSDDSGEEKTFAAVQEAANRWKTFRTKDNRNVMIIIVTDERGDDITHLEDTILGLKRLGIRVYCVGNEAVFGKEKGFVNFTDENGEHWSHIPVDQGPESVAPERLQLAYWGGGGDIENLSSSYGPYGLTRLCSETGGMFLVAEQPKGPRFDTTVMREYRPDYLSINAYKKELSKSPAKGSLVQAAIAASAEEIPTPELRFRADTDTNLKQAITEAQKPLAVLDYRLQEMHNLLETGEKQRAKLDAPRWRAGFDLAMGRVLAMRVRAYGYNVVLAEMKSSPRGFEKEGNNMWILVPSEETDAPAKIRKMGEKAAEYLNRVIKEHAGTPWELLARKELEQPMGWKWREGYVFIPKPPDPSDNPPPPERMREEQPRRIERKERGPQPKL